MLNTTRWLLFVPAGFIAAVVASVLGTVAGNQFSEFIGFSTSGALGAAAFIMVGMWVAPRKNNAVKWTLISVSTVFGILSAVGSMLGDDKLKVATGVSMAVISLGFAKLSPDEIRTDA